MQPMVGKMILPLLGGTPAVWSTCMVFFQAALLGGYAYAHVISARLRLSRQVPVHLIVLALPFLVLPLAVNPGLLRGGEVNPVLDVLILLSVSVGLPFLAVSATAPLLQRWFTRTGHPAAHDPYFLYAASNLGSMLALLGYPTLVEPHLHLQGASWLSQTRLWTAGYVGLVLLVALCALTLRWKPAGATTGATTVEPPEERPAWPRRLYWVALAFVPSSLLLQSFQTCLPTCHASSRLTSPSVTVSIKMSIAKRAAHWRLHGNAELKESGSSGAQTTGRRFSLSSKR